MQLAVQGTATIAELIDAPKWHGFCVRGRPSKVISDALRWEIERGRVERLGRGRYRPGYMPHGTEHRIHQRVLALRDSQVVAVRRAEGGPFPEGREYCARPDRAIALDF